jgi:hypothetical protein
MRPEKIVAKECSERDGMAIGYGHRNQLMEDAVTCFCCDSKEDSLFFFLLHSNLEA